MCRVNVSPDAVQRASAPSSFDADKKWLRGGYAFIAFVFATRIAYLAAHRVEITEDEAYQWIWSKHLALSYFSKPPLIAYAQFLGTGIWGDSEFGIRFLAPVFASILSVAMLRFMAREINARAGFWLIVMLGATPLLLLGSTLLTVDSPSVLFWVLAMIAGWRAMQSDRLTPWCWTGLFLGLGLMSKYTAAIQILGWPLFFLLYPPARQHMRRPGPYVALGIALLAFLPVIIWNAQHDWITLRHLADRGGVLPALQKWFPGLNSAGPAHAPVMPPAPSEAGALKRRFFEFVLSEFGLLNPVFFIGVLWAVFAFWRLAGRRPVLLYFFAMGAPIFAIYTLWTMVSRVLPNWIAPGVVPLFALLVGAADCYWPERRLRIKYGLAGGLALGFVAVGALHATELVFPLGSQVVKFFTGKALSVNVDPLHRVRGWKDIATMINSDRQKLAAEGKPAFLIADHYGLTSILTFYIPEAKKNVRDEPLVYYIRSEEPKNQFYYWPGYETRKGQNAIYVREKPPIALPPPAELVRDFASVTELGMRTAYYHGQPFREYQLFVCRDLR